MQAPIVIKPQTRRYLLFFVGIAAIGSIGILLSSSLIYGDVKLAYGGITGLWLCIPLVWSYDAITKFRRLTLLVTDGYIQIPSPTGIRLLSPQTLDKARTLAYMPRKNLNNWLSYSLWLVNGERYQINKLLYTSSDIEIILEKLGCL